MDVLREEILEFQERWNSMVLDITEDLKITCEEARTVRDWLGTERKAYGILKKKVNLQIRELRNGYDLRIKTEEDNPTAQELRLERDLKVHPLKSLLLAVEELQLKADEMRLRVERLLEQCE